jgi:predicted ATPase
MKRYILTGTPGCGKTAILRALEMKGYFVIGEAATDIIAYEQAQGNLRPWEHPNFIDQIVHLQRQRQEQISQVSSEIIQFYDRSPICTYALATHLKYEYSLALLEEIRRIEKNQIYQKRVLFIENLGFCIPTEARKISFEDSLAFEKIHKDTYEKLGFECVKIAAAPLFDRVSAILKSIELEDFQ